MNKRGQTGGGEENLYLRISYIVVLLVMFGALLYFITGKMTGNAPKAENLAKQIALFIDSSEPGMEIRIVHAAAKVILDEASKKVSVKIGDSEYSYNYVSSYKITFKDNLLETNIKIET